MIRLKQMLTEQAIIKSSEVPIEIQNWVESKLHTRLKSYKLHQQTSLTINIPWHEGDIEYYQPFKLGPNNSATEIGKMYKISGHPDSHQMPPEGKLDIPSGTVIVLAGVYPKRAEIYTGSGGIGILPAESKIELTDTELIILLAAKQLIASYRPKFKEEYYQRLIQAGYLAKNKSITIDGKNLIASLSQKQEIRDRVEAAKERFYQRNHSYLNVSI